MNEVIFKSVIDIFDSRYIYLDEIIKFYDINRLKYTAKNYGRYASELDYNQYLFSPAFGENMAFKCNLKNITTWKDVVECMELFLKKVVSWTPLITGPFNGETNYILCELLKINKMGFVTIDSQPGFYIDTKSEETRLQKPYIELIGPRSIIHNILNEAIIYILSNDSLSFLSVAKKDNSYIIDNITKLIERSFPYLDITEDIICIIFGVSTPNNSVEMDYFLEYTLTNKFFEDIIKILKNVKY